MAPYWFDTFVLLIHPQFGVFGSESTSQYKMLGAAPTFGEVTVAELWQCWQGHLFFCEIPYSNTHLDPSTWKNLGVSGTVTLSRDEAKALLALDPFFVAGGQNAPLDAKRAWRVASTTYGVVCDVLPNGTLVEHARPFHQEFDLSHVHTQTTTANTTYDAAVTDVAGASWSAGLKGEKIGIKKKDEGGGTVEITLTDGDQQTTHASVQVVYKNSTATTEAGSTTAEVTLDDRDNTDPSCSNCHPTFCVQPTPGQPTPQEPGLAKANIYLDTVFGSFMYQDPDAPMGIPPFGPPAFSPLLAPRIINPLVLQPFWEHLVATPAPGRGGSWIITATIKDALGFPAPNVAVNFSTTSGSVQPTTVMTDARGQASTVLSMIVPSVATVTGRVHGITAGNTITVSLTRGP